MGAASGNKSILRDFCIGSEAARIIGISPQTIINLARRGVLRHVRIGGNGMRLYLKEDVKRLARKKQQHMEEGR